MFKCYVGLYTMLSIGYSFILVPKLSLLNCFVHVNAPLCIDSTDTPFGGHGKLLV